MKKVIGSTIYTMLTTVGVTILAYETVRVLNRYHGKY